ncbi:DUF397 domain-containing protein [Streptomyces orinoci]|uniref:DUF397 domain-containing protein n=1 Tax=Streptomyces orinoci TaxID=67339 RepID=A0ABV3K5K3_STRON|nr:DUF397 domain-containing protein [Streptomyces orinoci]
MGSTADLAAMEWRTSSYTNGDGGNCVEVAEDHPGSIPVRDSKAPTGPALVFPTTSWASFIRTLKREALCTTG